MKIVVDFADAVLDFYHSWVDESLTVSIAGSDVIEISPVKSDEVDYLKVDIKQDFEKFIAESFSDWIKRNDRTYE